MTSISPASGVKDAVVAATITGTNFENGATAKLSRAGYQPFTATGLSVSSSTSISCNFRLSSADEGSYNVMVTNPGGQSDTLMGAFLIGQSPPILTGVYPNMAEIGDTQKPITIDGQNFKEGVKVTFVQGTSEINCGTPTFIDSTKISCLLNVRILDGAKFGLWDVKVMNIDGKQTGTLTGKFTVNNATVTST